VIAARPAAVHIAVGFTFFREALGFSSHLMMSRGIITDIRSKGVLTGQGIRRERGICARNGQ